MILHTTYQYVTWSDLLNVTPIFNLLYIALNALDDDHSCYHHFNRKSLSFFQWWISDDRFKCVCKLTSVYSANSCQLHILDDICSKIIKRIGFFRGGCYVLEPILQVNSMFIYCFSKIPNTENSWRKTFVNLYKCQMNPTSTKSIKWFKDVNISAHGQVLLPIFQTLKSVYKAFHGC